MRFISDEEVLVAIESGKLTKVNIKTKKSKIILKGKKNFLYTGFTYWAKSETNFAVKSSESILKILDLEFKEKAELIYEDRIDHVLHTSDNSFLVLCRSGAYLVDGNAPIVEEISLEEIPEKIQSGTALNKNFFFLHVKVKEDEQEGRVYDLVGNLVSKIAIPNHLK